jgi:predicted regulator of Ras-like GTPase activity (Roadblock/LC7/MglB family)
MGDNREVEDIQVAVERILAELVEHTAHVRGAVLGSTDGHPLAARLDDVAADASSVAAMGAATVGLATQLVRVATDAPVASNHIRADGIQVLVLDVSRAATLTVFASDTADEAVVASAAERAVDRLVTALAA